MTLPSSTSSLNPEEQLLKYAQSFSVDEPLFKTLVEWIPFGLTLSSANRDLAYANKAFANIIGYSQEELAGLDWTQLTYEEDRDINVSIYQKLVKGEVSQFEIEKRYRHKKGHLFWCRVLVTLIHNKDTGEKLSLALIEDIDKQKKINQELEWQKTLVQKGEEVARLGSFSWNIESNEVEASPGLLRIYELDPATSSSSIFEEAMRLTHPDDMLRLRNDVMRSVQERINIQTEFRIRFPDGRVKWLKSMPGGFIDDKRMLRTVQDITEDVLKSQLLDQQREMLEIGGKSAGLASFIWNTESKEVLACFGVDELFGLNKKLHGPKGLFQKMTSMAHPDDQETLTSHLAGIAKTKKGGSISYRIILENGETKWLKTSSGKFLSETEKLATIQDITEEVKQTQLLERQKEIIEIGEKSAGIGTFVWDILTREVYATPGMFELAGMDPKAYTPKEIMQKLLAMTHPDDLEILTTNLDTIAGEKVLKPIEWRVILDSGETRWWRTSPGKFLNEREKLGTIQDITEEKNRKLALERQEELLRVGEEVANMGVDIWNIETGEFYYSDHLLEMFQLDPKEVNSKNLIEQLERRFHPEDLSKTDALTEKLMHNPEERLELIHRLLFPDGEVRWMQVISERFKDTLSRITINKDITEFIHQSAKLKDSQHQMEQLLYSVSHDLRAPLRHVSSYAKMVQASTLEKLDETEAKYLRNVISSSARLGVMIDELLQYFRSRNVEMKIEEISLQEITEKTSELFSADTDQRKIAWHIGELPYIKGDKNMIEKVMLNLLSNAVKFTSRTEKARIEITAEELGNMMLIKVADNGAGFKMKYKDKLFAVFQRLHKKSDFEGTGIGLSNVQRIIERHGGKIWAEGEVGKGASFYFTLPKNISH